MYPVPRSKFESVPSRFVRQILRNENRTCNSVIRLQGWFVSWLFYEALRTARIFGRKMKAVVT